MATTEADVVNGLLGRGARRALHCAVALVLAAGVTLLVVRTAADAAPKPTLDQVGQQVKALRSQAEQLTENYDGAQEKATSLGVRISAARTELAGQRQAVELARKRLGRIAADVYKAGDLATVQLFLGDRPDGYVAASGLLTSLVDRRVEAVDDLTRQRALMVGRMTDLAEQQELLQRTQAQLAAQKSEIEAKLAAASAMLARLTPGERQQLQQRDAADEQAGLRGVGVPVPASGSLTCDDVHIQAVDARVEKVLHYACAQLGDPYQWGAAGPNRFDCSGFTMMAWKQAGVSLPHNAAMQATYGTRVSVDNLAVGDVVFFYQPIGHNGIYLGNGLMIHAPRTGETIRIVPVRYLGPVTAAVRL
ncbi:MAG TPA: NlpC/P60 family protein [Kineosporiaceae bacterium]